MSKKSISLALNIGAQKGQPENSKILTPSGFKKLKDVSVGDEVVLDGRISRIKEVRASGLIDCQKITFKYGSNFECGVDNCLPVKNRRDRNKVTSKGVNFNENFTVDQMIYYLAYGNDYDKHFSIDNCYSIGAGAEPGKVMIDPYVLGVIIGDGCLTGGSSINICMPDKEVFDAVNDRIPEGFELIRITKEKSDYRIKTNLVRNPHRIELERLGLWGKHSYEKHIPEEYMQLNRNQRLWLLRGLMDTDGTVDVKKKDGKIISGSACYCTTSEQLADDVITLVHSLGGYASKRKKRGKYKKNGEEIICKWAYMLSISFPARESDIFYLSRKAKIYNPKRERTYRFITEILKIENKVKCLCIIVDDDEHYYLTDDYIRINDGTV